MLTSGIVQGICILAGVAAIYGMVLPTGASEGQARAVAFTGIVFGNVALILANRSRYASLRSMLGTYNPALWMVGAGALLALAATLMIEPVRALFRFDAIGIALFDLGAAAALPGLAALAALKLYTARRAPNTVRARDERQPARRTE